MARARFGARLTGCLLLMMGAASFAEAAPTVAQMLSYRPKQEGVQFETPDANEYSSCEVKVVVGSRPGSSGWLLLDARKRPLRRYFDSNGDKKVDMWSYYKDGQEVYREIDSNFNERPDQFRWFNAGGMRWGISPAEDGKISHWKMISADEVAQEIFLAVASRDFIRLQALFISEAEMTALRVPAAQVERIRGMLAQAPTKFQALLAKMPDMSSKIPMWQLESAPPHCIPGEAIGAEQDLIKYPTRRILFEKGAGTHDWLQTGEMIQVGLAWRLLDTPSLEVEDEELGKLLKRLAEMQPPAPPGNVGAEIVKHELARVTILEQIEGRDKESKRETWIRQIADSLSTAAQYSDKQDNSNIVKLQELEKRAAAKAPALQSYIRFRTLWAEYQPKIIKGDEGTPKAQEEWVNKLSAFVQSFPKSDDTPDALFQAAMHSEFLGKEDNAKNFYRQLATNFPSHPMAPKADGCARRLDSVGKAFELNGTTLQKTPFNSDVLKGKVTVVYYWASYCKTCADDFAKLKKIQETLADKGAQIITVNLDDTAENAQAYLDKNPFAVTHLYSQPGDGGGLNSALAIHYGVLGLPNVFLVGRDGRVISRTIQVHELEDAIRKAP